MLLLCLESLIIIKIMCLVKPLFLIAFAVNQYGITPKEVRDLVLGAESEFSKIGVCPRIVRIKRIPDLTGKITYTNAVKRFHRYLKFAHRKKLRAIANRVHFILTPEFIGEHRAISGAAYPCSAFSYSTAQLYDETGADRRGHSMIALAHEMGHSLGAFHEANLESIMHPNPLPKVGVSPLYFTDHTKEEILKCLQ